MKNKEQDSYLNKSYPLHEGYLPDSLHNDKKTNYPDVENKWYHKWILMAIFIALFGGLILYWTSCKPCKDLIVTKTDTVKQTVVQFDTVEIQNKDLYNEIQEVYCEKDSFEYELNKCLNRPAGIIINNSGKWKQKGNKIQFEQYYLDRINSLTMTNSRIMQENRDLKNKVIIKDNVEKDKSKVKTDNSVREIPVSKLGFLCRNMLWFCIFVFFIGFGCGGYVTYKIRKIL